MSTPKQIPAIQCAILSGPEAGQVFQSSGEAIVIGRDMASDVALLSDTSVSQRHAEIRWRGNAWSLRDLKSKNGTYVHTADGRERVKSKTSLQLPKWIVVGRCTIHVSLATAPLEDREKPLSLIHKGRLHLRVLQSGERLEFSVISAHGPTPIADCSHPTALIEEGLTRLRSLAFHISVSRQENAEGAEAEFRELIAILTARLLPEVVADLLSSCAPERLLLEHSPRLIPYPWEILTVGDTPLCLRYPMTRRVHQAMRSIVETPAPPFQPERLLVICNPTGDLSAAQSPTEEFLAWLEVAPLGVEIDYLAEQRASRIEVLRRMAQASMVYFVGHAEFNPEDPLKSCWHLANGPLSAGDFRAMPSVPSFVFANACHSSRESAWTSRYQLPERAYGLASGFLLAGARAYLGAQWQVPTEDAAFFGTHVLRALLRSHDLPGAVHSARNAVRDNDSVSSLTWASYTLYGDSPRRRV